MTPEELYNDAENALKVAGRAFYPLEREPRALQAIVWLGMREPARRLL